MGRILLLCLVWMACGCPGAADPKLLTDGSLTDGGVEADVRNSDGPAGTDGQPDQAPVDLAGCAPEDAVTSCDPIAASGCPAGAGCYVVQAGSQVDCICPAGTRGEGVSCNATAECLPGFGCAGSQAPGVCRQMCDPAAASCPGDQQCTALNGLPQFGICGPPAP